MSAGKILFVEDELSSNVSTLLRLFKEQLRPVEKKSLEEIERDSSNFGATNEDIKAIFKDNTLIDVEYSFPGALKSISEKYDDYLLFIVDRNLSKSPSELPDIQAIDATFTEDAYIKYMDREGDYLLGWLATKAKGINCCDSFYFMTAHGPEQSLKNKEIIDTFIDLNVFKKDNFIEKTNNNDFSRLFGIINDFDTLTLLKKYFEVFEVFEKGWLDNKYRKNLTAAIKNMDNHQNIKINAVTARNILESIYDSLVDEGFIPADIYNNKQRKFWALREEDGELSMRTIIEYLKREKKLSGVQIPAAEFTYGMASQIVHWIPGRRPEPSKYSNHALVCCLCDSILWFKDAMNKIKVCK